MSTSRVLRYPRPGTDQDVSYGSHAAPERPPVLLIVGRPSLQNTLLAELLERHLGGRCVVAPLGDDASDTGTLTALLDVGSSADADTDSQLGVLCHRDSVRAIAIFNADERIAWDRLLRWPKMKGVFHRDVSEQQLVKGVRAICGGECWLPRKILADYLDRTRNAHFGKAAATVCLTPKEAEILRFMGQGASNAHIATSLNVSPHTVKTHVYNLFRKIKVKNRVQAVSWALNNLEREGSE